MAESIRHKSYIGSVATAYGFHPTGSFPIDERMVVETEADLYIQNTWMVKEDGTNTDLTRYVGMVVVTKDTGDVYVLKDKDTTQKNSWKKISTDLNIQGDTVEIVTNTFTSSTPSGDNGEVITVTNYYWWGDGNEIVSGSVIPEDATEILWKVSEEATEYPKDGKFLTPVSTEIAAIYNGGEGTYLVLDLDGNGFGDNDVYIKASALVDFSKYVEKTVYEEKISEIDSSITDIKDKMVTDVSISLGDPSLSQFFNITKTEKDENGIISITYDASVLDTYDESITDENGNRLGENKLITDRYVKEMMSWTEVNTDDDWNSIIDLPPTDETEGTNESETTE